jgi:hypothetical protein
MTSSIARPPFVGEHLEFRLLVQSVVECEQLDDITLLVQDYCLQLKVQTVSKRDK